jgi:hypothetical protein
MMKTVVAADVLTGPLPGSSFFEERQQHSQSTQSTTTAPQMNIPRIRYSQGPYCAITADVENTHMKIQKESIFRSVIPTPEAVIFVVTTVRM